MKDNNKKKGNLTKNLDDFLTNEDTQGQEIECDENGVCRIKQDKSLVERINKKVITEDGRELLT